jgi:antitoxin Phd
MQTWQLQDAKARLSEVIKRAVNEGPQEITVRGEPTAVVLSADEFKKLKAPAKSKPSLVEMLQSSPWMGVELDLTRDKSLPVDKPLFDE